MTYPDHLFQLWTCAVLALSASCLSITVTQTELFAPMRAWISQKNSLIGHLFQCFYCLSHWVVFVGIFVYQPTLVSSSFKFIDLVISAFFTIGLSTFFSGIVFKVFISALSKARLENEVMG
ncbi:hypothetical protein FKG94_16290 [Exilibacterium tricleocarpae]|uniref:DUF1360 domain-containing protein n=1 Tax=Exilibacterium tricleocarpae TaxID=2591008 RepID=A0A545TAD3_9GAMM|nr:hypothetical protein [Exilibacterium tricleocarpae]TQV74167.1 hypothetical protein FKG94_16290 [Exilibacterium tricleocarpae]